MNRSVAGQVRGGGFASLEYFPPSSVTAERALVTCAHALRRFDPVYQTVTFGADGGARDSTLEWATTLRDLTDVPTATHLTLCAFDRPGLLDHAQQLKDAGIERVILLRGDAIREGEDGLAGFASVADAVGALKRGFGFDITVSAYPEKHPKAADTRSDLDALCAKFDAGADRAVTQFFFDEAPFLRLRDALARKRPDAALVAGVMPINDHKRVRRFAAKCGTAFPTALARDFEAAEAGDRTAIARDFIERQVRRLANEGERRLHVYTMNRIDLTADALRAFEAALPEEAVAAVA